MAGDERAAAAAAAAAADVGSDTLRLRYPLTHDFEFAYDSDHFSDRVLRLVIVPGDEFRGSFNLPRRSNSGHVERSEDVASDMTRLGLDGVMTQEGCSTGIETTQQIREEAKHILKKCNEQHDETTQLIREEARHILKEDNEHHEDLCTTTAQEGIDIAPLKSGSEDPLPAERVRTIKINSAILAAHSAVFLKMFSNGMKESTEKVITYQISESEEVPMMEVVGFLYSAKLTTVDPGTLLDIFMIADRFGIIPLMKYCTELLVSLPMDDTSAVLLLSCPYTPSLVIDAAKEYLLDKYHNLTTIPDDCWNLPLIGIELIFGSTEMQIQSEDQVYDFLAKWVHRHYPRKAERHSVCKSKLIPLVRFSNMSDKKVDEIVSGNGIGLHRETTLECIAVRKQTLNKKPDRNYSLKPITVVEFSGSCPQTVLFFDLRKQDCSRMFPHGSVYSHTFGLAGEELYLAARCETNVETGIHYFGLWVGMIGRENGSSLALEVKFSSRDWHGRFHLKHQQQVVLLGDEQQGTADLFDVPWEIF